MLVQSTREAMARSFYEMFPDGVWWVSLYGWKATNRRKWSWRRFRLVNERILDRTARVELTQRFKVKVTLDRQFIVPEHRTWRFVRCQPACYDRMAIHATQDGPMIDMCGMATVNLNGPLLPNPGVAICMKAAGINQLDEPPEDIPTKMTAEQAMAMGNEIVLTVENFEQT